MTKLITVSIDKLIALRRNPQYLSERQNKALRESIERDGFLCPVVVRKHKKVKDSYEILSGNHRVNASRESGLKELPCVLVHPCDDKRAARIAVNMNTVHGDPTPELLAPFLAEIDDESLQSLFLDRDLIAGIVAFDQTLQERLKLLELPDVLNSKGNQGAGIPNCVCKCGDRHVAHAPSASRSNKQRTMGESKSSSTKGSTRHSSVAASSTPAA